MLPVPARLPIAAFMLAAAMLLGDGREGAAEAAEGGLTFFRIGTGPTATASYALGTAISAGISKPPRSPACDEAKVCGVPGLIAVAQSTESGLSAVRSMLDGDLESAIVPSDIAYWAYTGGGPFSDLFPIEDLRVIANLISFILYIVVDADSGIESIADLSGKKVSLGTEGSGTVSTAINALDVYGITLDQVDESFLKPGPAADALAAGQIDAFFHVGAVPDQVIRDLQREVPLRLLSIGAGELERLYNQYPFITTAEIPAGFYGQASATTTISISAKWVTLARQPEDLISKITRALWRGDARRIYERNTPDAKFADESRGAWSIGIPLHPGAAKYYKDVADKKRVPVAPPAAGAVQSKAAAQNNDS